VEPQSISVPLDQFDTVTSLVEENEHTTGEDVLAEVLPDDRHQAIMGLAKVDGLAT